jgi:hypothetical protein
MPEHFTEILIAIQKEAAALRKAYILIPYCDSPSA